jgi:hypothetical protein
MSNLGKIESLKLAANFANGLAIALITVGVFGPVAALIYGSAAIAVEADLLWQLPLVCICLAIGLHLAGQWFLTVLDEIDE